MNLRFLGLGLVVLLAAGITLGAGLQTFSAYNALQQSRHSHQPPRLQNGAIRPWMTIHYVSTATHVPERYLFEQVGIPLAGHNRIPIDQLAHHYHRSLHQFIQQLQQAVRNYPGTTEAARPPVNPVSRSDLNRPRGEL